MNKGRDAWAADGVDSVGGPPRRWVPTTARRNAWVAGGVASASLLLCVLAAGDAIAVRQSSPDDPEALRLLSEAAGDARTTPYEGTRFMATWDAGKVTRSQVRVVHTTEDGTLVHTESGSAGAGRGSFQPDAGLAGLTLRTLRLLARNYSVVRGPDSRICGRQARVVEARRADGSVAGRFGVDRATGLMLYRELVDAYGDPVTVTGFSALDLTAGAGEHTRAFGRGVSVEGVSRPAAGRTAVASPWGHALAEADLEALRGRGWTLPSRLPGGLNLYAARRSDHDSVVHLDYSDGLSTVSVFVQRGELDDRQFTGWRKRTAHGSPIFERNGLQRWAVWASRGYVYTVLADAAQDTTESVVAVLPHGGSGFWARPVRGLGRLGSWLNLSK